MKMCSNESWAVIFGHNRTGFLLVDLLISIVILTTISCMLLKYQLNTIVQYYEIKQETKAIQAASDFLEIIRANHKLPNASSQQRDDITITYTVLPIDQLLPEDSNNLASFVLLEITAAWRKKNGTLAKYTLVGGVQLA